ncbi:MAG TPA: PDZ domain-containing protein, partial [Opitutaceae bacterium]|nr:PDZ domain-containing protein [Opitutaceae bacterium]
SHRVKLAIVNLSLLLATAVPGADLPDLWQARLRSVAAVDYTVAAEIGPHEVTSFGVAVDRNGTLVLPWEAVDASVPIAQLQHFRVYLPGESEGHDATYLGSSAYWGFQYIRADAATAARLAPITEWGRRWRFTQDAGVAADAAPGDVRIGESVWGIALRSKEEAFAPYLLMSHVALVQRIPQTVGITQEAVAGPGLPVFDRAGNWIGLAASSFGQDYLEYSPERPKGGPVMLVNLEESSAFVRSAECAGGFRSLPAGPDGRPIPWIGSIALAGLPDGSLQVDQVEPGSPAAESGLRPGDRIVGENGRPRRPLVPLSSEVAAFQRELEWARPGEALHLQVRRDEGSVTITVVVADAPKLVREAQRRYYPGPGVVIREPVAADGGGDGAIVADERPEGPAAAAGLRIGDRIVAIDGSPAGSFFETAGRLAAQGGAATLTVERAGSGPNTLHVHWNR